MPPKAVLVLDIKGERGSWNLSRAKLRVLDPALEAASAITSAEQALVDGWHTACSIRLLEDARFEGSSDFLRARVAAYFEKMTQAAATQLIGGSTAQLEKDHGPAFVHAWMQSEAMSRWAARNGVQAALRLWRARHAAPDVGAESRPPFEAPATAAAAAVSAAVGGATSAVARCVGARVSSFWSSQWLPRVHAGAVEASAAEDPARAAAREATARWSLAEAEDAFFGAREHCGERHDGERPRPHGHGVRYADGTIYLGEWKHGSRDGFGCETRPVGEQSWRAAFGALPLRGRLGREMYTGRWRAGVPHGAGRLAAPCFGALFKGVWCDGHLHGEGVGWWADGNAPCYGERCDEERVRGEEASSSPQAGGAVMCAYEGSWRRGIRHGFGSEEVWRGGAPTERYEGEWADGVRCGVGRCVWLSGSRRFPEGATYSGEWFRGEPHGAGTLVRDGREEEGGWWAEGELVELAQ